MDLPEYTSVRLPRSPLLLVAAQINFEDVGREVAHVQARSVQKRMGPGWTRLESAPLVQTTVTPGGAVNEPNRQAYRLSAPAGSWTLQLNPSTVTLETRAYEGWVTFRMQLAALVTAVAEVFDPASEQRLGLRYIDQVPLPDGRSGWNGLIEKSLLGLTLDQRFAGSVLASDQRVLLQLDGDTRCVLRYGQVPDPATNQAAETYLLDYDVFRENREYDPASVIAGADALHDYVGGLFRASITDDLYAWLAAG
jgi:uncharacterized protein (TIGR04255 family)